MDIKAIEKAASRLRVATKAIDSLPGCKDHAEFTDAWYTFLTAAKNIYTVLEQGAKVSAQSRQWFGAKAAERRGDALLQYLYEARNDDEHGLEQVAELDPGGTAIGVAKQGFSNSITLNGTFGPGKVMSITSNDGKPVLIENRSPHSKLSIITARGGRRLMPPSTHMGRQLPDGSPYTVGRTALLYLTELIEDARGRVT